MEYFPFCIQTENNTIQVYNKSMKDDNSKKNLTIDIPLNPKTLESIYSYSFVTGRSIRECAQEVLQYRFELIHEEPKKPNTTFTFIDLFAGIGGIRIAFEEAGGQCVFSSEWDKYSQKTYYENFSVIPHGDITKINELDIPDHDILVAGFPCQPFSIAGVSKKNSLGKLTGFLDKTQGTLFFDIVRILSAKKPKAFLLENVKNLMSHDKGRTYKVIRESLDDLNYEVTAKVMDGQYFAPQHRERILIVGFDRNQYSKPPKFDFSNLPVPEIKLAVKDILQEQVDKKYTLSDHLWKYLQDYASKHKAKGNGFGYGLANLEGTSRTLSARYHKDGSEILIPQDNKNPRRLTPRECARLQGFPDSFKIVVSDTQAYRQFGNAVVVPLITVVAKAIVHTLNESSQ